MGGGQTKGAHARVDDICDHTPIFACFDGLPDADALAFKEKVAGLFERKAVAHDKSVFAAGIGRQDLVIVEKGELQMISVRADGAEPQVIKTVPNWPSGDLASKLGLILRDTSS